jgi:hypothetical protein
MFRDLCSRCFAAAVSIAPARRQMSQVEQTAQPEYRWILPNLPAAKNRPAKKIGRGMHPYHAKDYPHVSFAVSYRHPEFLP